MNSNDEPDLRDQLAAAYDANATQLYRFALMILADTGAAEDAVQQAFMKLAGMGDRLGELKSQAGYLRVAVRNECYRILERRQPQENLQEQTGVMLEPVDAALANDDERQAIETALRALPAEQREVIHLKVYEAMTFQQIADLLGISLNTAASRYRYATEKLRQLLSEFQSDEV